MKTALRVLHAIRKEMASVVKRDFDGVRVQFQGDRVQALFHLPKRDDEKIAKRAVDCAIGLQSSMELVIKKLLPEAADLGMAVGSLLEKLLSRSSARTATETGSALAIPSKRQPGTRKVVAAEKLRFLRTHIPLDEELQKLFVWNSNRGLYIGTNITHEKAERARKAGLFKQSVFVTSGTAGAHVSSQAAAGAAHLFRQDHMRVRPKPWFERREGACYLQNKPWWRSTIRTWLFESILIPAGCAS